jgi:hypothetical protein
LIACSSSSAESCGLKMKATSVPGSMRCSSVRQSVVLPVPTSPVMAMKPSPCSMP